MKLNFWHEWSWPNMTEKIPVYPTQRINDACTPCSTIIEMSCSTRICCIKRWDVRIDWKGWPTHHLIQISHPFPRHSRYCWMNDRTIFYQPSATSENHSNEIELKHYTSYKTSIKLPRKCFMQLNGWKLDTKHCWLNSAIGRAVV